MGKYAVVNPATGETVKEYPQISDEDLSAAIAAALDAHQNWGLNTSVPERASLVKKVADLHSERREALAEIAVREMGKPMEQALGEVDFCVDIYGYYADNAEEFLADEPIKLLAGDGSALIRRSSVGPRVAAGHGVILSPAADSAGGDEAAPGADVTRTWKPGRC